MWSVAVGDLGLTSAQFWALTPVQFFALCERKKQELYREDLRMGILASLTANIHRGKNQSAFKPQDFMPLADIVEYTEELEAEELHHKFLAIMGSKINGQ